MRRFIMWWALGWVAIVAVDVVVGWGAPTAVKALDVFVGLFYLILGPAVVVTWHVSDGLVARMSEKTLLVSLGAVVGALILGIVLGNWIALVVGVLVAFGFVIANLNRVVAGTMAGRKAPVTPQQRAQAEERSMAFGRVAGELRREHDLGGDEGPGA